VSLTFIFGLFLIEFEHGNLVLHLVELRLPMLFRSFVLLIPHLHLKEQVFLVLDDPVLLLGNLLVLLSSLLNCFFLELFQALKLCQDVFFFFLKQEAHLINFVDDPVHGEGVHSAYIAKEQFVGLVRKHAHSHLVVRRQSAHCLHSHLSSEQRSLLLTQWLQTVR
jgi:hypothetical protein